MLSLPDPRPAVDLLPRLYFYRDNPIEFAVDVLGAERKLVWPGMHEIFNSVIRNRRTAIAGCHNSSKTFSTACLIWWWVLCWPDAIAYITAAKEDQITDTIWAQMRTRYESSPVNLGGRLLELDWKDHGQTRILGRTAKKDTGGGGVTGMQGVKSQRLLMIFEEATAIDRAVWESANGIVTFPENRWVALANPTNPNCGFRDCFRAGSGWHTLNIDALQTPNLLAGEIVHPYLPTPEWVDDMRKLYGEGSPAWESRVRGRFPSAAIDTLISLADFEMALLRDPPAQIDRTVWIGVDIAAQGDDYSVICVVQNDDVVHLEWFHEPDTTKTADRILEVALAHGVTSGRAHQITVDMGGVGKSPYDNLRRRGWKIRGEDFSWNAHDEKQWRNRRTEIWAGVKTWLNTVGSFRTAKRTDMTWAQKLESDLCGCTVAFVAYKGRTVRLLEKKLDMKKRLGHSPDWGDALALALAPRTARGMAYDPRRLAEQLDSPGTSGPGPVVSGRYAEREAVRAPSRSTRTERPGIYDGGDAGDFYGE